MAACIIFKIVTPTFYICDLINFQTVYKMTSQLSLLAEREYKKNPTLYCFQTFWHQTVKKKF